MYRYWCRVSMVSTFRLVPQISINHEEIQTTWKICNNICKRQGREEGNVCILSFNFLRLLFITNKLFVFCISLCKYSHHTATTANECWWVNDPSCHPTWFCLATVAPWNNLKKLYKFRSHRTYSQNAPVTLKAFFILSAQLHTEDVASRMVSTCSFPKQVKLKIEKVGFHEPFDGICRIGAPKYVNFSRHYNLYTVDFRWLPNFEAISNIPAN